MTTIRRSTTARTLACLLLAAAAGGCGGVDGVEFNGGVFNAIGLGGSSAAVEPKAEARAGLVLPPQRDRLPEPGSSPVVTASTDAAWPVDPDERKRQNSAALQAQHQEYCRKQLERKRLNNDLSATNGPLGNCDPSVLRSLNVGVNNGVGGAIGGSTANQLPVSERPR